MRVKVIVIVIAIIIAIAGISYYSSIQQSPAFLDIVDYIITADDSPLLLSLTVAEKIPKSVGDTGYGFAWLEKNSLTGYTVNIHSGTGAPQWHAEKITISDSAKFCFDDAELIDGSIVIDQNKISVAFEKYIKVDQIISYEIIHDNNCHGEIAGKIVEKIIAK